MDNMSFIDILFVGIPEVFLTILTGLIILGKNLNEYKDNKLLFSLKISISLLSILLIIYFSRRSLNSIVAIGAISTLAYMVNYRFTWSLNWRESIVLSNITIFLIGILEIGLSPYSDYILCNFNQGYYFDNRIILSIPLRVIQFVILIVIYKSKLTLYNVYLINRDWIELTKSNQLTAILLLILISLNSLFNFNFSELFIKLQINKIDTTLMNINLKIYIFENFIFAIVVFILFSRTSKYEYYKIALNKKPENLFWDILESSSTQDLIYYEELLDSYLTIQSSGESEQSIETT